jgi:signal peptidase I
MIWRALMLAFVTALTLAMVASALAIFVFHLSIRPVLTGSMEPTFGPGWAIVTQPVATTNLRTGEIIVFRPPGETTIFAHRIVSISGPAGHPVVRTRGDANPTEDPWHARVVTKTAPVVIFAVPWIGNVLVDLEHGAARVLLIALLGLVVCLAGAHAILGPRPVGVRRSAPERLKGSRPPPSQ